MTATGHESERDCQAIRRLGELVFARRQLISHEMERIHLAFTLERAGGHETRPPLHDRRGDGLRVHTVPVGRLRELTGAIGLVRQERTDFG